MCDGNLTNSIDYLYQEYGRLTDRLHEYSQSSFDDFKWFAAIGVLLLAWKPIADTGLFGAVYSNFVLLIGFIAILLVISIIGTRDLLKQSIINYHLQHMVFYEVEIKAKLGQTDARTFSFAKEAGEWQKHKQFPIERRLYLLFIVPVMSFPTLILSFQDPPWYAAIYFGCVLFALLIYWDAARKV